MEDGVAGGSSTYIGLMTGATGRQLTVLPSSSIDGVARSETHATVTFVDRPAMTFDDVVFACHGDEVLPLLTDATVRERDVFAAFRTTSNTTWLHTDERVLPTRPDARASWNYLLPADADRPPTVTYHLNRLQNIPGRTQYCVTLNPDEEIDEACVLRKMVYTHPLYTRDAIRAQRRWAEVSGTSRTHYAGAYWFYGFHEDGLNSALRVAKALGVDW